MKKSQPHGEKTGLKTGRYKNQETSPQIARGELWLTTAYSHEGLC
jgi:hypothetical protein